MGHAEEPDPLHVFSFSTALLVAVMILWTTLGHKLAHKSPLIGEGSAACLLGLVVGLVLLVSEKLFHPQVLQDLLQFDPENFFIFFLPPIIFYAGLSVKKKHFFRNFFTIAGYGVVGTYICFALISIALYLFVGHLLSFGDCLALGAILAATDSVAALQVISQERFPLLYSMVFGEGVLNDATSIVILGTLQELQLEYVKDLTLGVVGSILGKFLYLFMASSLLGMVFGLLTAFLLRKMKIESTAQEVALIGMTAYLSYLMGDVLGLSGILALFVSAVAISHYALHSISAESRTTTIYSFQTLSYISEGIIFVYCGLDALDPLKWKNADIRELLWMFWILVILLVVTRAAFVLPVSLLHNRFAQHKLEYREMVVIWWAGLMRGAVSVALVYYYFDPHGSSNDAHTSTMITTTLIVVLISIIAFGAMTKPLLQCVMGPMESPHTAAGSVEMAQPAQKRLGGNTYMAVGEDLGLDHSTEDGSPAIQAGLAQPKEGTVAPKHHADEVPIYQDNDFAPMSGAAPGRSPSDTLHEVCIDQSPKSATAPASGGTPDAKRAPRLMGGLKGFVDHARAKSKVSGGGNEDFLFEFEALARGKEAGAGAGVGGNQNVNIVADARRGASASSVQLPRAPPAAVVAPAPSLGGGKSSALLAPGVGLRKESSGEAYAPDSTAVLARINRWWKRVDEKHLQPVFGGPAIASTTQASASQHGAPPSSSGKSFTVPATSRNG